MQNFWYRNATCTAKNAQRWDPGTPAPNWPGPWDPSAKLARTPGTQHQIGPDPGSWGGRVPERGARIYVEYQVPPHMTCRGRGHRIEI